MSNKKAEKKKTHKLNKSILPFIFLSIFIVLLAGSITLYSFTIVKDYTVVATINGMDIAAGELKNQMSSDRANIITYYTDKYDATIDKKFWNTKIDGKTPMKYLRDTALETVKRNKIEQQLGLKYKVIDDASYKSFVMKLESVNKERAEKVAKGEPIYGSMEYSKATYLDYILSNMRNDLHDPMSQKGEPLYASDSALKNYYDDNKGTKYVKTDTYTFKAFTINYKSETVESKYTDAQALEIIKAVHNIVVNDKNYLDTIKAEYPDVNVLDLTLDYEHASNYSKTNREMYNQSIILNSGDISEAFKDEEKSCYRVVKCFSRIDAGYLPYTDVQDVVRTDYNSDAYDYYIEKLYKKYIVTTNSKYDRVTLQ